MSNVIRKTKILILKQLIIFPLIIASGFGCSPEVVCAFMASVSE